MQAMNESELAATYGQAIFEVSENIVQQENGSELNMLRITMGAHIEINANVDELALGRYWRPEGTNCTGGAGGDKVCYNNVVPVDYDDNIAWACTANPCGSVGLGEAEYESSLLTHGSATSFFDYPGGFEPDAGVDIKLRDITMGQAIDVGGGVYELTPFVQDNPYIEFAFDESTAAQKLVGFRVGAENSYGYQGNIIDVISGFIEPTITAEIELIGIGLGSLELEAFLGGVRTIGWLDSSNLTLYAVNGALVNLLVSDPESVLDESPTAQLFPVQSNYLDNTAAFFISMGTRSIQWSEVQGFSPEVTSPGFWLNMGGDGGLISYTQNGDHPNNYFPGHPNFQQYGANTNYGNASTRPSWSQTYNN
ncbi:MAG: hypothetical protein CMI02_07975 [Oceanospirillaceae bacterium]|nr:hypothetical protein [Oceanospirillaceae bacterium]MBT11957.1 hypothetical protein [Oceanospirillaceae bacterium]|tara:strand:- start:70103 stop:71200 length:1098 start_codon:yes stop_codon:yes gene_type:complete